MAADKRLGTGRKRRGALFELQDEKRVVVFAIKAPRRRTVVAAVDQVVLLRARRECAHRLAKGDRFAVEGEGVEVRNERIAVGDGKGRSMPCRHDARASRKGDAR